VLTRCGRGSSAGFPHGRTGSSSRGHFREPAQGPTGLARVNQHGLSPSPAAGGRWRVYCLSSACRHGAATGCRESPSPPCSRGHMSAQRQRARSATVEITHFDHERIPGRVVHARGHRRAISGHLLRHRGLGIRTGSLAYGAAIPVFCGLSTVLSSPAGSVRDIRRLAVGFYSATPRSIWPTTDRGGYQCPQRTPLSGHSQPMPSHRLAITRSRCRGCGTTRPFRQPIPAAAACARN